VDVFGRATGFTTYRPFATPLVPTDSTALPDVAKPPEAVLVAVSSDDEPPDAVVALDTDAVDPAFGKRTL